MTNTLLDIIDRLTTGTNIGTVLDDGTKHWEFHEGLIPQLRAASASSIVGGSAAGASPAGRIPLNPDAVELYKRVEDAILERFTGGELGVPGQFPESNLRIWYGWFTGDEHAIEQEARYWSYWVRSIEDLFDPPKTMQVLGACPACGSTSWTNTAGDVVAHPVVIEYRGEDVADVVARCRATLPDGPCGKQWRGMDQLRELRWDLGAEVTA